MNGLCIVLTNNLTPAIFTGDFWVSYQERILVVVATRDHTFPFAKPTPPHSYEAQTPLWKQPLKFSYSIVKAAGLVATLWTSPFSNGVKPRLLLSTHILVFYSHLYSKLPFDLPGHALKKGGIDFSYLIAFLQIFSLAPPVKSPEFPRIRCLNGNKMYMEFECITGKEREEGWECAPKSTVSGEAESREQRLRFLFSIRIIFREV